MPFTNILALLSRAYARCPEGAIKTRLRFLLYAAASIYKRRSERIDFNGVVFQMRRCPLLGGLTGFEHAAMIGYVKYRDIMPGDTVVDCGPYSGDFTIYASIKAGPTGGVIAFEPDPTSVFLLQSNIRLNDLRNVTVIKKGVWSNDGPMRLTGEGDRSQIMPPDDRRYVRIAVCTLDTEIVRMGAKRVDFIKMDIEGAEVEALKGMKRTLQWHPHIVCASYHKYGNSNTSSAVEGILRENGYKAITDNPAHLTTHGIYDKA